MSDAILHELFACLHRNRREVIKPSKVLKDLRTSQSHLRHINRVRAHQRTGEVILREQRLLDKPASLIEHAPLGDTTINVAKIVKGIDVVVLQRRCLARLLLVVEDDVIVPELARR